jgi:YVTN family beta-propeller protein
MVTAIVIVGNSPWAAEVTPSGRFAYIANSGFSNVSVIQTLANTVTATIAKWRYPRGCGGHARRGFRLCDEGGFGQRVLHPDFGQQRDRHRTGWRRPQRRGDRAGSYASLSFVSPTTARVNSQPSFIQSQACCPHLHRKRAPRYQSIATLGPVTASKLGL